MHEYDIIVCIYVCTYTRVIESVDSISSSLTIDRKILLLALTRPKFRNLTTITAIPRNIKRTDTAIPVPAPAWELN